LSFEYKAGLRNVFAPEIAFEATFGVRATGNEIVIVRKDEDRETEVCRVPLAGKPDLSALRSQIARFYSEGIHGRLKLMSKEPQASG
jgi:hypothetical protein